MRLWNPRRARLPLRIKADVLQIMNKKTKTIILDVLSIFCILVLALFSIVRFYIAPGIQELCITEGIKGDWIGVQDYVKAKGRYPNDEKELYDYYKLTPTGEEPIYIKPQDDNEDEVILWSREKTLSGKRIGIRECGLVKIEGKQ